MKSPAFPGDFPAETGTTHTSGPLSTRDRILELAIVAIDRGGEAAVRVNETAAEAGVSLPTLYRYFGSREGLIESAQEARFNRDRGTLLGDLSDRLRECASKDELKQLLRNEMSARFDDEHRATRHVRVNSLGSGYARPDLLASLAASQRSSACALAELLRPFQERGWIRAEVDLAAFVYWYLGQLMGRVLIEIGGNVVPEDQWNATSLAAVNSVLFGDTPYA